MLLTPHSLTPHGEAIGTDDAGRTVLVPYALPGEVVEVRIERQYSDRSHARLVKVVQPASDRIAPACPVFSQCGGCQLQHWQQEAYYTFKEQRLRDMIEKAGYSADVMNAAIRIGPASRRRATLQVQNGRLGFYAESSHRVVPVDHCPALVPALSALITPLTALLKTLPFHPETIQLTQADSGIDLLFTALKEPNVRMYEELAGFAAAHTIARLTWKKGKEYIPIYGSNAIVMVHDTIRVPLPEEYFLQATQAGQQALTEVVLTACGDAGRVLDLYAGCGTYSFPLLRANEKRKVHAVEVGRAMVEAMSIARNRYSLTNCLTLEARDLERQPLPPAMVNGFDAVVINPPRTGAKTQTEQLAQSTLRRIVMVSCNPATFSRDAAILRQQGFQLEKAIPVDQFYWSGHLEVVGVFGR